MRPTNIAAGSFIFGPTSSAFRYAEELWRTLPRPNSAETVILAKAFEAAFSGLSLNATVLEGLNLRRPHFTACFNGIFGGGTTGFPGEFALANYGLLLFAEIDSFKPEIVSGLAERLKKPPPEGFPVVFIHGARATDLPAPLASLNWPRVQL